MERFRFPWSKERDFRSVNPYLLLELEAGLGMGLGNGRPFDIPVRESDFVFFCDLWRIWCDLWNLLIFVLMSSFILFMDISTRSRKLFNKLLCLGFGVCFLFQVFLSIGGCDKIHSIHWSYDSTRKLWRNFCDQYFDHFNIIQGLHMLADSEGRRIWAY